jgi:serine/threonine protein kinase/tetratricopeptide (TPR) repeat protein
MTPELWDRLKPLLDEAVEKLPQERASFMDRACGDDRELKLQLELLVDAHARPNRKNPIMSTRECLPNVTRFSADEVILERFRIVRLLGSGGMGEVYEALDLELGRIALKTIRYDITANAEMLSRFKHEVQFARQISDPHVCRIHELFVLPNSSRGLTTAFLTMEFLEGITLSDWIAQNGAITYPEAESIALQLCAGLQAIHDGGVIHRDLKSRNIMLATAGRGMRVVVMDFGLARLTSNSESTSITTATGPNVIVGTPEYMAPEQFEGGELTPATDIYALGVVLYELTTGRRPFAGRTPVAAAVRRGKHPEPASSIQPTLPRSWDSVIDRCLEYDASHRFQSASEVADGLQRHSVTLTGNLAVTQDSTPNFDFKGRRSAYLIFWVVAIVLLAGGIIWSIRLIAHWRSPAPGEPQVLLLGSFENRTGDPVFDTTLSEMFSAVLEQSNYLLIYPHSRVSEILQAMGRAPNEPIDEKTGLEICQRAGLNALLSGSISRLGTNYILIVRAQRPSAEDILTETRTVASASQVPAAVDSLGASLRRGLGESPSSLKKDVVPLATVTSPSLDAIRFYTVGKEDLYSGDLNDAVQMFAKALELDRNFAMAHETLGITYEHLREFERERKELREAMLLSDRVSQPERLKILGIYYNSIMDYEKGCGYYKTLSEIRPTDPLPFINLGVCRKNVFDFSGAEAYTTKAVQMLPKSRVRINLASQIFLGGDTARSLAIAEPLSKEYPTDVVAQRVMGNIYLAAGKLEESRKTFSRMVKVHGDEETAGHIGLADLGLSTGRYRDAKEELGSAILSAEKSGNRFAQENARITLAETLIMSHSFSEAGRELSRITPLKNFGVLSLLLGKAYARNHQPELARRNLPIIDDLISEADTPALRSMKYLLEAEIALSQHKFSAAIDSAVKANAYYPSSFAVETLARCYDSAGRRDEAVKEYQTVLRRGNERTDSFDAPAFSRVVYAHYRLGVLFQELGRKDDARAELSRFLFYWSRPDPDLEAAKDAHRRLQVLEKSVPTPAI